MKTIVLLALLGFFGLPAWAAAPVQPKPRPYTVLQIIYYDGTEKIEAVKVEEGLWRVHQIGSEHRLWEDADRLARAQWHDWFGLFTLENRARQWVLPKPVPPVFATYGRYEDEFDTEDQVRKLKSDYEKRMAKLRTFTDQTSLAYLDNLTENRKLVRTLLPKAREARLKRTDESVKRWTDSKKREIWDVVFQAEAKARFQVAEQTPPGEEYDILAIYNAQQELLKAIYLQYKMTDEQWYIVWEEGDRAKWPTPKPEFLPATLENVTQALRDMKSGMEGQWPFVVLKNMGKSALPHLLAIAEDAKLNLKPEALRALPVAGGVALGSDLERWKGLVREQAAAKAKAAEAERLAKAQEAERKAQVAQAARQTRAAAEAEAQKPAGLAGVLNGAGKKAEAPPPVRPAAGPAVAEEEEAK